MGGCGRAQGTGPAPSGGRANLKSVDESRAENESEQDMADGECRETEHDEIQRIQTHFGSVICCSDLFLWPMVLPVVLPAPTLPGSQAGRLARKINLYGI